MTEHYTAWITNDRSCLETDHCDVTVLADKATSYRQDDEGNEIPDWESTGPAVFSAVTTVTVDADHAELIGQAEALLSEGGWHVVRNGDSTWQGVPTGYIAEVTR
jgi:hypothetical protein